MPPDNLIPVEKGTLKKNQDGAYFIQKGDEITPVEKGTLKKRGDDFFIVSTSQEQDYIPPVEDSPET